MNRSTLLPTAIPPARSPVNRSTLRRGSLLITLVLAWFALSPAAQAVKPAPDGGYANGNTAEGTNALFSLTSGTDNTANGASALQNNTTGGSNTAIGFEALFSNTTGSNNTAIGFEALFSNTTITGFSGFNNTATGSQALFSNTDGGNNTATGADALQANTMGFDNTATGVGALQSNTGSFNTANGAFALQSNTTGINNTAIGFRALELNTTGTDNTATGVTALQSNTTGSNNTATGENALFSNTTGNYNTATGVGALQNNNATGNTGSGYAALSFNSTGSNNTAEGFFALLNSTGSNNIALGSNSGVNLTTGSNNIDIGNVGVAGEASKIRIGTVGTQKATFIAGIRGVTVAGGVGVIVGTNGQFGTTTSSERFKEAIKPMDKVSEAILHLRPVTFCYKHELDPDGIPQFGLIAEQVEKVNPDLVVRDAEGKINTVRYEAVNAMLLNEFLKEHHKVQQQEATITRLKSTVAQQQKGMEILAASLKEQAAQIQKVSTQLELSKPAPRLMANNQ